MASTADIGLALVTLMLEPAARFARRAGLDLDAFVELAENAYFREYRARELSVPQIAKRLRKSERTIASIKKRSEAGDVLASSAPIRVRRAIVLQLTRGASNEGALTQHFRRVDRARFAEELAYLEEQGVVLRTVRRGQTMLSLSTALVPLQLAEATARLDAVRQYLSATSQAIANRFSHLKTPPFAFVRVFTFPVSGASLSAIAEAAATQLQELAARADAAATEDNVHAAMTFSFLDQADGQ